MEKRINVLLIDDDEVDIMNMQRAFKLKGIEHPLYIARNGEDALYQLKYTDLPKPHIILLDINMPKMNGVEFLEAFRQDEYFNDVVVYIITTSNEDIDKRKVYDLNVSGYILKPLAGNDFVLQVSELNKK